MSTSHYSECSVISVAQLHTMLGLLARAGLALKPLLCFSVEREGRKRLSRHGSVEIFDGSYNLTVPHRLSRHTSTSKLEEIHTDHIKIAGELEDNDLEQNIGNERRSNIKTFISSIRR